MTNERVDDETMAAFLDGTLSASERGRVLRILSESPDAHEDFVETAAVASAVRDAAPSGLDTSGKPARWRLTTRAAVSLLAAASIVGIAFLARRDGGADPMTMARSLALAEQEGPGTLDRSLGTGWDQPAWSTLRGATGAVAGRGLPARLGVRTVQLEAAATARDSVAHRRVAASLVELLAQVEGSGPLAGRVAGAIAESAADRAALSAQLRRLSGGEVAFDFGAWIEVLQLSTRTSAGRRTPPDVGEPLEQLESLRRVVERLRRGGDAATWEPAIAPLVPLLDRSRTLAPSTAEIQVRTDSALAAIPR